MTTNCSPVLVRGGWGWNTEIKKTTPFFRNTLYHQASMFFCSCQAAGGYSRTLPTWTSPPSARSLGSRVTRLDKLMDIWVKKNLFGISLWNARSCSFSLSIKLSCADNKQEYSNALFKVSNTFSPSRVVNQRPFRYLKYFMSTAWLAMRWFYLKRCPKILTRSAVFTRAICFQEEVADFSFSFGQTDICEGNIVTLFYILWLSK